MTSWPLVTSERQTMTACRIHPSSTNYPLTNSFLEHATFLHYRCSRTLLARLATTASNHPLTVCDGGARNEDCSKVEGSAYTHTNNPSWCRFCNSEKKKNGWMTDGWRSPLTQIHVTTAFSPDYTLCQRVRDGVNLLPENFSREMCRIGSGS